MKVNTSSTRSAVSSAPGQAPAAFAEDAGQAPVAEALKQRGQIKLAVGLERDLDQRRAALGPGLPAGRLGLGMVTEPQRRLGGGRAEAPAARQRQRAANHHPHRPHVSKADVAHVEPRIVAASGARADQHRVGSRAHQMHLAPRGGAGDPPALARSGGDAPVD